MIPKLDDPIAHQENTLLAVAQEIAMDMLTLEEILKAHNLTSEQFDQINRSPRFQALLNAAIASWASALNVEARVMLKTQHAVEMALPEMFAQLHDPKSTLTAAKVELFKALQRGAGIGAKDMGGSAEKVTITINMGAGQQTQVTADLPSRVNTIEHEDA